jgi:sec-independent protein translocase protein TatA
MGLIIILAIVLILFGPKRLPDLGKSMRKGMRAFKEEISPADDAVSDKAPGDAESRSDGSDGPTHA